MITIYEVATVAFFTVICFMVGLFVIEIVRFFKKRKKDREGKR